MIPLFFRCFLFISLLLGLTSGIEARGPEEQVVGFTFDWDDNIFNMPTKIQIFHKQSGKEIGLNTAEFALVSDEIDKPGTKYADYEMRDSKDEGSLRHFSDFSEDGDQRFLKDIKTAMSESQNKWQGPVWKDFVSAMSYPASASNTWLITARSHRPETIHSALKVLKEEGLIKNVPPVNNIWPVNDIDFVKRFHMTFGIKLPAESQIGTSARKAVVMEQILDRIETTVLPLKAEIVTSPNGRTKGRFHLWGFSDDDYGNFEKAVQVLQKNLDSGRWRSIKITVFFTGRNHPGISPHAVTLIPGEKPRPFAEHTEWKKILNDYGGKLLKLSTPSPEQKCPVGIR